MKGKLPGDFYKFWVDIASLPYDRLYTVGDLDWKAGKFAHFVKSCYCLPSAYRDIELTVPKKNPP